MTDDYTQALLEAHELLVEERCKMEEGMEYNDEFEEGHINGLDEARNRVEQLILERVDDE